MILYPVPAFKVDEAWSDGADCLEEACHEECTIDQLKMLCSRGERQLVRMDNEGQIVGWGVFMVDQRPNFRVLHITNLVAHNAHFELFFDLLKDIAKDLGCSRIRSCAGPAQARLYAQKLSFEHVYATVEYKVGE